MTKIRKMQIHQIIDRIQKQDKLCFHGKIKYMTMLNQLLRDKVEITKKLEFCTFNCQSVYLAQVLVVHYTNYSTCITPINLLFWNHWADLLIKLVRNVHWSSTKIFIPIRKSTTETMDCFYQNLMTQIYFIRVIWNIFIVFLLFYFYLLLYWLIFLS